MLSVLNHITDFYITDKRIVTALIVIMITLMVLAFLFIPSMSVQAGPATSGSYCGC